MVKAGDMARLTSAIVDAMKTYQLEECKPHADEAQSQRGVEKVQVYIPSNRRHDPKLGGQFGRAAAKAYLENKASIKCPNEAASSWLG